MLYVISKIILLICILSMIIGFNNLLISFNYYKKERNLFLKNKFKYKCNAYFYILIPALREQNVIIRTLERLSNLDYPRDMYEIIVALDAKEKPKSQYNKKTKDVVLTYIKNNRSKIKIRIIEYKGSKQKRACQLNQALKYINSLKNNKSTFIGVYDADSYPDLNILRYINFSFNEDNSKAAFQQNLNYLHNSKNIKNSIILSSNAYYQTMWNYLFEINQFIKTNKRINNNKKSTFPPYCMGHGEFIRLDILNYIDGFSEEDVADGIQIGFKLTRHNMRIFPVPFEDYCESPEDLYTLYKQHTYWFLGNMTFFKKLKAKKLFLIDFIQNLNHLLLAFKWLIRPFLVTFVLIVLSIYNWILALLFIVLIYSYYLIGYYFIKKYLLKNVDFKVYKLKYGGLELLFGVYYKSFGAINGSHKIMKSLFKKQEVEYNNFHKVER